MKPCPQSDADNAIVQELYTAAEKLSPGARTVPLGELYEELEDMGADRWLLGIAGAWGDTLGDEEVLAWLREWNETGTVEFESYVLRLNRSPCAIWPSAFRTGSISNGRGPC